MNNLWSNKIVPYLLVAHPLRHGYNAAVAFNCSCQGEADTCRQPGDEILSNLPCLCYVFVFCDLASTTTCFYIFLPRYLCCQRWAQWLCLLVWGSRLSQHLPPSAGRSCLSRCLLHWRTRTWPLNKTVVKQSTVTECVLVWLRLWKDHVIHIMYFCIILFWIIVTELGQKSTKLKHCVKMLFPSFFPTSTKIFSASWNNRTQVCFMCVVLFLWSVTVVMYCLCLWRSSAQYVIVKTGVQH